MRIANVKNNKMCAFCKYWYDPANSFIRPKSPGSYHWEYDEKATSHCSHGTSVQTRRSAQSCQYYECKL